MDAIDYLRNVCFINSLQAILVSRKLKSQNYQNLEDRYVQMTFVIACKSVFCIQVNYKMSTLLRWFSAFPIHDTTTSYKHWMVNFIQRVTDGLEITALIILFTWHIFVKMFDISELN